MEDIGNRIRNKERRKDRKSVIGSRGNSRQFISSLISPQSFQPSHFSSFAMQMLEAQANLLGQAAHKNREKREGAGRKGAKDDDDKLSERE